RQIGVRLGTIWKEQGVDVDLDTVMLGLKDGLAGTPTLMTEKERDQTLMDYQKELRAKVEEKRKEEGAKNKKEGEAFLAANKVKPGVVTLPDGLQYKVITEGKGENPQATDTVTVNYKGTTIDGAEFDSSYQRGQPATFPLNRVIKGWTEALQLMKPGAKWELFLPPTLAYGELGHGPKIGPEATLIFEVELLSVKPPVAVTNAPVTSDIIKVPSAAEIKNGAKIEVIKKEDLPKK
ncbi:MAG: FKBP-type peptidyl-prolyl cis-trans isomerase, partial [Candidatus Omnitrophica bacterium]|nr:FKBP-type peptidyl-prolyl cis-trans isomerase [Candidatus Omnitrophota bacterium]